ncbi:hypothetical protein BT69DRAFT_386576 [Atractiella rhizophila]|nr:hypothetical protein BT69DRAFT_386576 [Atractiella rhizophila]
MIVRQFFRTPRRHLSSSSSSPSTLHQAIPRSTEFMLPLPPPVTLSSERLHHLHQLACILPPASPSDFEELRLSLEELMRLVEGVRSFPLENNVELTNDVRGGRLVVNARDILRKPQREETKFDRDLLDLPRRKEGGFYVAPMPEGLVGKGRIGRRLRNEKDKMLPNNLD